ncbi:Coiled-coil domain-containing protein 78 [Holothuria leucospilota]|uniref:Coiled-coil domain-containing protein 78 n=1 Tax=Holothuria leucospilota TaxID=206669 RepID=A0A9Q1C9Z6_HOLLE|nr:Coiled-coil domain-containing protein 78 [Holothuria leucospilota]
MPVVSHTKFYDEDSSNRVVFETCIQPMVDLFLAGFNLSFLCLGEIQSGRSFTLLGDNQKYMGVVHFTVQTLLEKIAESNEGPLHGDSPSTVKINLKMYEVYNEVIRDLFQPGVGTQPGEMGCNPQNWFHIKNVTKVPLTSDDVMTSLRNGWNQRTSTVTDFGDAKSRATIIIEFEANVSMDQYGYPHRSFLRFADLPALDNFQADVQEVQRREGTGLNKSVVALQQLVTDLSKIKDPSHVFNYSESKVTSLLSDSFGGNSKTKVMVHLKPSSSPAMAKTLLQFSSQLSQIRNYFILNDVAAQGLLTQMRAKILSLQNQLGVQSMMKPSAGSQKNVDQLIDDEEIMRYGKRKNPIIFGGGQRSPGVTRGHTLKTLLTQYLEAKLRMENGYMVRKLDRLQNQFSDVAASKEDLSRRLIESEEERLRASRSLVDVKIENSNLKEKLAQENFELKNKLMSLESDLLQEQNERRRALNNYSHTRNRYEGLENESRTLADQYADLQAKYEALIKKHDLEVRKNQELGMELLNLLNAEVALLKQQDNLQNASYHESYSTEDLRRIRDIAVGLSAERDKVNDPSPDTSSLRNILFGDTERFKKDVDKMKSVYDQQQDALQSQIKRLNEDIKKSKLQALEVQKKLTKQEVELMMAKESAKEMEREINNLNLQIRDKNEEFRKRLQKYLDDITDYVEQASQIPNAGQVLRGTVDKITQDLKKTYQNREKQLSEAARSFRNQSQKVAKKHEKLLVAYRLLKKQVSSQGETDTDPEEHELSLSDANLESINRQELTKLGLEMKMLKEQLEKARKDGVMNNSLESLKAQYQEQQDEIEKERSALLASNALLEEQLAESQAYIRREIPRYKEEIQALRRKLGITDQPQYDYFGAPRRDPYLDYVRRQGPARTFPEF